ncbi:DUF3349 domain-containing protein [Corallococcus exercitus]|uniref:DUF3349 domain-containing protein n=1 Tax=Corallococcus exercitus TaxID=2316736 RepID=UPI001C10D6E9|nr:DUF3349 domain-containing protein [Corallococcus exercitus]
MSTEADHAHTLAMLGRAFPEGVSEADYRPLLAVLYPYFSDRNLADVVSRFTGRAYGLVLNDVYGVQSTKLTADAVASIHARLVVAGLDAWSKED